MRVRLLPWRPPLRAVTRTEPASILDNAGLAGVDLDLALVATLVFVLAAVLACLVLFSIELAVALALLPFLMAGQLLGRLPWVLVITSAAGEKRHVEVRGVRRMLAARKYYRSLRA